MSDYHILPPSLAIKSMRDSGYRDAAHALAELVDNSIQAGIEFEKNTSVEIICIDKIEMIKQRKRTRIDKIAVYDNACGMDSDTLRIALQFGNGTRLTAECQKGIGKFGMGLPNASISQCRRVDVWSWQNGETLYTYLDVDEIIEGALHSVPTPVPRELPEEWRKMIRDEIGESGTLVLWSKLDRVRWRTSKALFRNSEKLIGRMYRHFLQDQQTLIRLASFDNNSSQGIIPQPTFDDDVRPNDPLYLMTQTSAPAPYDAKPAFIEFTSYPLEVGYDGKTHQVMLTFSHTTKGPREEGGSSAIGKDTAANIGVSVVRSNRELSLNRSFDITYDPIERWWGVEVAFTPELDEVFGVTNNKQAATAFLQCDLDKDAEAEGMTSQEYKESLKDAGDPRLAVYAISQCITKEIKKMRDQIKRMKEGSRSKAIAPPPGSPEAIATKATQQRLERTGEAGQSDIVDKQLTDKQKQQAIAEVLIDAGATEKEAKDKAIDYVKKHYKYIFQEGPVPGYSIFDISSKGGVLVITLNTKHPANESLFEEIQSAEESTASDALKLMLSAWARLEDEAGESQRQKLEDVRSDWGRIARDFLQTAKDH